MSELDSLIRVSKWRLDEKRREAADLERLADRLALDLENLDSEVLEEGKVTAMPEMAVFEIGGYVEDLVARKDRLKRSIAEARHRMVAVGEEISEAFAELKRFEILQEDRRRREKRAQLRRETAEFDEVSAVRHVRKGQSGRHNNNGKAPIPSGD